LLNYLDCTNIVLKIQFGFKAHHSTVKELLRITKLIKNSFEKHCHTGAIFIAISKAYDKVRLSRLVYKLKHMNDKITSLTQQFYLFPDRQFSVKINDSLSTF